MGTKKPEPPASSSIGDALFTKVQQRVLAVLFGNHGRGFYANELISLACSGPAQFSANSLSLGPSGQ
jgi:hypothetical protein